MPATPNKDVTVGQFEAMGSSATVECMARHTIPEVPEHLLLLMHDDDDDNNDEDDEGNEDNEDLGHLPPSKLERVFRFLARCSDARAVDSEGNGAFHYAVCGDVLRGHTKDGSTTEKLFQRLQAAGADVNLKNKGGKTPLHLICSDLEGLWKKFDEKLFMALVHAGADLNARDQSGRTPLFALIENRTPKDYLAICRAMSQAGARLDTTDDKGRNLLHAAVSNPDSPPALLCLIVDSGLDPLALDAEGKTLWHEAVPRLMRWPLRRRRDLCEFLFAQGVDHRRPNNLGRTPLHDASSIWYLRNGEPPPGEMMAFDHILELYSKQDVNLGDQDGVTPLHLACTFSEFQAQRLLDAGADPSRRTTEGLSGLHHAARCKQGNIIGILLESLGASQGTAGGDSAAVLSLVDAKDTCGRTALHYACTSGRAENVRMLLHAGATFASVTYQGSVWQACVDFEDEQANWPETSNTMIQLLKAGGVLVADKRRPNPVRWRKFPVEPLNEVVDILVTRGGPRIDLLDEAISSAVNNGNIDYTVECLLQARNSIQNVSPYPIDEKTLSCLERRRAVCPSGGSNRSVEQLMRLRRYDLVETLLLQHGSDWLDGDKDTTIHDLLHEGFIWILRRVQPLVLELAVKLEKRESAEDEKTPTSEAGLIRPGFARPLLQAACQSEVPNMEALRFLVEEVGCRVDVQGYRSFSNEAQRTYETPIHCLVRGMCHWWKVAEALPYLVRVHGADLEVRDGQGRTPLNVALDNVNLGIFNRRAVDALIELGADLKTADLTSVGENIELTEFLLSRGAVVTTDALIAAIKARNCALLRVLLSNGGDPNTRQVKEKPQQTVNPLVSTDPLTALSLSRLTPKQLAYIKRPPDPHLVPVDEMYPLDYAAYLYGAARHVQNNVEQRRPYEELIEVLVAYGADWSMKYAYPDGEEMSIKDWITKRAGAVERISELCAAQR
ncbi:hypothetical protein SLS53_006222 [Cytospora paraplurivora]|uniref:Ankyrin repeat protein n=1 Tax=Cytospora paraplurivora TaxID=2898453 RepID=A0AAN9UBZ4_9PEZI